VGIFNSSTEQPTGQPNEQLTSARRVLRYTALVGVVTWFVMNGGKIYGTPYTLPGISDWVVGYPYEIKKTIQAPDNEREKLQREYAEYMKIHSLSKRQPVYSGGAPRSAKPNSISFLVTMLVTGFTFFKLNKNRTKKNAKRSI